MTKYVPFKCKVCELGVAPVVFGFICVCPGASTPVIQPAEPEVIAIRAPELHDLKHYEIKYQMQMRQVAAITTAGTMSMIGVSGSSGTVMLKT